jgi:hypothetical protein
MPIDIFEYANLWPENTGLPMTVWIKSGGGVRDVPLSDVQIMVNTAHGNSTDIERTATVGIKPTPHLREGNLSSSDLAAVSKWVALNEDVLIDSWEGRISLGDAFHGLTKV